MNHRSLTSIGILAVWIALVLLFTVSVTAQAPASAGKAPAAAKKWTPGSKTPDGQPDLQGFWTNSTYVPLQRPNNVNKEFYTPAEAEAAEKAAAEREGEQTTPGTVADVHYDFTQFGLDRNQSTFVRNLRTSLITDPANGKLPPNNAEGTKRAAERAAERKRAGATTDMVQNMPLGTRCMVMNGSGPPLANAGYNANYQIVQGPGYVMLLTEMLHEARIIPLDGRPQPPQQVRQWGGISRGRWEGDTLIVETSNYNGKNPYQGASENMRVTEKFKRTDADHISYTFTVTDESTWDRPWTAELPLRSTVGPIFEHACHEGNYGVTNTLSGARIEDKRAAEAAAKKGSK